MPKPHKMSRKPHPWRGHSEQQERDAEGLGCLRRGGSLEHDCVRVGGDAFIALPAHRYGERDELCQLITTDDSPWSERSSCCVPGSAPGDRLADGAAPAGTS
ncbi:probable nicotinate mononucleotide adenylyltransferase [Streptomyces sp. NBRC 110611]|nr:probable nicotinate mononucleotide adenylyltransferase [Streptomyces sp. NBRC 110611]